MKHFSGHSPAPNKSRGASPVSLSSWLLTSCVECQFPRSSRGRNRSGVVLRSWQKLSQTTVCGWTAANRRISVRSWPEPQGRLWPTSCQSTVALSVCSTSLPVVAPPTHQLAGSTAAVEPIHRTEAGRSSLHSSCLLNLIGIPHPDLASRAAARYGPPHRSCWNTP